MAAATPYMTSTDLIEAVKRKISIPISQQTFTVLDILAFANEEMMISQVPSVLIYHQEYYVYNVFAPLLSNVNNYPIPDRAVAMRLRDLFYVDQSGNKYEMSRIQTEDQAYFSRNLGTNQSLHKFYLEGNDVVLASQMITNPIGQLRFGIFIRPNQLVTNDRAATVTAFAKTITVDNSTLAAGDTITLTSFNASGIPTYYILTAVSAITGPNQFLIDTTSINTATNLSNAILSSGASSNVSNGTPSTAVVTVIYNSLNTTFQSLNSINQPSSGLNVQVGQGVQFNAIPAIWQNPVTLISEPLFANNTLVDFLQTKAGHKIRAFDILIPAKGISGLIINFNAGDVPQDLIINDYICLANECIIPFLPPDLHNGLAERAAARVLAALGDQIGLQISTQKIQDIDSRQGNLLDNRVDGSPLKVTGRKSLLRFGKRNTFRF